MYYNKFPKRNKFASGAFYVLVALGLIALAFIITGIFAWGFASVISWGIAKLFNVHELGGVPIFPIVFVLIFLISFFSSKSSSNK